MKPEIILEIDAKGKNVSIEVKGVSGRQCVETARSFEDALGEVVRRELKNEYFVEKSGTRGRLRTTGSGNPGASNEAV